MYFRVAGGGPRHRRWEVGTKVGVRTWGRAGLGPQELRETGEMVGTREGSGRGGKDVVKYAKKSPIPAAAGNILQWAQPGGCDLGSLCGSIISCPHLPSYLLSSASCPGPLGVPPPELRSLGQALLSASPLCRHWKWGSSYLAPSSPPPRASQLIQMCIVWLSELGSELGQPGDC